MKNLLSIATCCMVMFVVISFTSCNAQVPKANLKTDMDTLAYTMGISHADGLAGYLRDQMGIELTDETKAAFIKGFLEGINLGDDMKNQAYLRGQDIGVQVGTQMLPQINNGLFGVDGTESLNKDQFYAGFIGAFLSKDLLIDPFAAQTISMEMASRIENKRNESYLIENKAFLEENKKDPNVVELPSGLQYKVITEGTGERPTDADIVEVHYIGTTIHGNEFDSSVSRGESIKFGLTQVIQGWTEGLKLMPVGSKYMLYIPYDLAYGEQGREGSIDPYATLIFEVELLGIEKE